MAQPVTHILESKVKDLPYLLNAIGRKVDQTEIPKHALLLGAGCSYKCGIPLGSGIIELCRMHAFINDRFIKEDYLKGCDNYFDPRKLGEHITKSGKIDEYKAYVAEKERQITEELTANRPNYVKYIRAMTEGDAADEALWQDYEASLTADSKYGFWINALAENEEERQHFIEDIMKDKKPDGAYILLSYLIAQRTFTNVLTTNFDDLINEALIYYTETQCRFYADDELSKYISIHSSKPNIIKLHGDFRFANMSNTVAETSSLSPNLQNKFMQLLGQLGLIMIGYNGADHSIMSVLYKLKKEGNNYPLIWCGTDPAQVHWRVAQLINNTSNSYFITIKSFAQLTGQLASHFLNNKIEQNNIIAEAKKRQQLVERTLQEFKLEFKESSASAEEKAKLEKALSSMDYAKQAYGAKDPEEQIKLYTQAIKLDDQFTTAYNNRGIAYADLKQYEKAIADYTKAIELDEKYATAYYNRGIAYADLKQYEKAIADYTKAIELDEKYATAYYNRGNAYNNLERYEEALADYTKAIELDKQYAVAYYNRSNCFNKMKNPKQAKADLAKAKELGLEV